MDEAETQYGVPAQLLEAIAWRESRFDPEAISDAGAIGLMQFMPETAKWLGIDPNDPKQAIHGAAKYLTYLKGRFGGDWRKAIAAYHAGQGNVGKSIKKYGDKWLEKGDEFGLGPITRSYVEEMEPILYAMEAQPEPTTYAALDPRTVNRQTQPPAPTTPTALPEEDTASFMPNEVSDPHAQFYPMDLPELDPLQPVRPAATPGEVGPGGSRNPMFPRMDGEPGEGFALPTGGYGTVLKMGAKKLASAGTGFLDTASGVVLNAPPLFEGFRESMSQSVEDDAASLRLDLQAARNKKWFTTDDPAWADIQSWLVQSTEQGPNLVVTILPPIRAARMAYTAAIAKGMAPAAARKVAEKAAALAGGVAEGGIVTGYTRDQIESEILNADHAQLMEVLPQYRELIELHGDTPEGQRTAKLAIARDLSEGYSLLAGGGSYLMGRWAGAWLGKVVTGGGRGGRLANAARTGATETIQESGQEGYEQMVSNLALGRPLMEGVAEAATAGGALGGPPGAVIGLASPPRRTAPTKPDTAIPDGTEPTPPADTGPQVDEATAKAAVEEAAKRPLAGLAAAEAKAQAAKAATTPTAKPKPAEDLGPDEGVPKRKVGTATSQPSPSMSNFLEANEDAKEEWGKLYELTNAQLKELAAKELGDDFKPKSMNTKAKMSEAIIRKRRGLELTGDIEGYTATPEQKVVKRDREYDAPADTWTGGIDRLRAGGTLQSEAALKTMNEEVRRLSDALPARFTALPKGASGVRAYSTFLRGVAEKVGPEGRSAIRNLRRAIQRQDAEGITAAVDDLLLAEQTQSFMNAQDSAIAKAIIWARAKASRVVRREGKLTKRAGEEEGNRTARRVLHRGADKATVSQQLDAVADYGHALKRAVDRINHLATTQGKQLEKAAKAAERARNKRKDKKFTEAEKAVRRRYQQWKKWSEGGIQFGAFKEEEFYKILKSIDRLQRQAAGVKATVGQTTASIHGVAPKDSPTVSIVTGSTETVGYTARNVAQKWTKLAAYETKILETLKALEEEVTDTKPAAVTRKKTEQNAVLLEIDEALPKRPHRHVYNEEDAIAAYDVGALSAYAAMVRREYASRYQKRTDLLEDLLWAQEQELLELEDKYWARKAGHDHKAGREAHAKRKYKAEAKLVYQKYAAMAKEVQQRYAALDEGYAEAVANLKQYEEAKAEAKRLERVAESAEEVLEEQIDDWEKLTGVNPGQVASGAPSTKPGKAYRQRLNRFVGKKRKKYIGAYQEVGLTTDVDKDDLPKPPKRDRGSALTKEEKKAILRRLRPVHADMELGSTDRIPKITAGTKLTRGEAEHPLKRGTAPYWRHNVRARGLQVLRLKPVAPNPVVGTDITGQRELDPDRARAGAGFGSAAVRPMHHTTADLLARQVESMLEDAPNVSDIISSKVSEEITGGRPQQLISPIKLLRLLEANGFRTSAFARLVEARFPEMRTKKSYRYVVTVTAPDGSFKTSFDGDNPDVAYREISEFLHDVRNKNLMWPTHRSPKLGGIIATHFGDISAPLRSATDQDLRFVRRRDTSYKETVVREGTKYLDKKHKRAGLPDHADTTYKIELVEYSEPAPDAVRTLEMDLASTTESILAQLADAGVDAINIDGTDEYIVLRKPSTRLVNFGVPIPSNEELAKEGFVNDLWSKLKPLNRQQRRQQLNRMKASELLQVMKYLRIGKANITKPERVEWLLDHFAKQGTVPAPKKLTAAEQAEVNKRVAKQKAHEIFVMRAKTMTGAGGLNTWGTLAKQTIEWLTAQIEKAQRNNKTLDFYIPPPHYNELSKKALAQIEKLRQDATNERAARALRYYMQQLKMYPRDDKGNVDTSDFSPWFRKRFEFQQEQAKLAENKEPLKIPETDEELGEYRISQNIDTWLVDLGLSDLIGSTPKKIDLLKQELPEVNTRSWVQMRALRQAIRDQRGVASLREYDNVTNVLIAAPNDSDAWAAAYTKLGTLMQNYFGDGTKPAKGDKKGYTADFWVQRVLGYTNRLNELYEQRLEEDADARAEAIKGEIDHLLSMDDDKLQETLYDMQYEDDTAPEPEGTFDEIGVVITGDAELDAALAELDPGGITDEQIAALRKENPEAADALVAAREKAQQPVFERTDDTAEFTPLQQGREVESEDVGTTRPLSDELYREDVAAPDTAVGAALNMSAPNTASWLRESLNAHRKSAFFKDEYTGMTAHEFVTALLDELRANGSNFMGMLPLLEHIAELGLEIPVEFIAPSNTVMLKGATAPARYKTGITTKSARFDPDGRRIYINEDSTDDALLTNLLHEVVHAATSTKYRMDAGTATAVDVALQEVRNTLLENNLVRVAPDGSYVTTLKAAEDLGVADNVRVYGLTSAEELLAETMASGDLNKLLRNAPRRVANPIKQALITLWRHIKQAFGFKAEQETLFDMMVPVLRDAMMSDADQRSLAGYRALQPGEFLNAEGVRSRVVSQLNEQAKVKGSWAKRLAKEGNLGFMDLDFMLRKYKGLFDRAKKFLGDSTKNPLTRYVRESLRSVAEVRKLSAKAQNLVERNLKLSKQARQMLAELELESTLASIYADGTLDPAGKNRHLYKFDKKSGNTFLKKASSKVEFAKLKAKYEALKALSPDAAKLYVEKYEMTREVHQRKLWETRRLVGLNGGLSHEQAKVFADSRTLTAVKAKIKAGSLKFPDDKLQASALKGLKEANKLGNSVAGPYFHVYRPGDYFVYTTDEGDKVVSTYRTEYEAKTALKELQASGRVAAISRKIESAMLDQPMSSVISDMMANLPDPDTAKDKEDREARRAIRQRLEQAAVIAAAADSIIESSRLKRNNVQGANPKDQLEGFIKYINSSLYAIGDLHSLYDTKEALKDLNALTEIGSQNPELTEDEALLVGDIARELKLRIKHGAAFQDVTGVEQFMGTFGFMAFLGSPAYWFLNSTQTVAIGLPVLAARTRKGVGESTNALISAMSVVVKAARKGSNGGLDLDKLIANLPAKYRPVAEKLRDDGSITSNIAQEFGDLLSASKTKMPLAWKVLKVFEHMPQRIEHFNRLSMAIAAVELGANLELARDVTEESQFLYDPANRARLLKYAPMWAGGGLRPLITPIMMFKVFGINATRLLYGNMIEAAKISKKLRDPNLSNAAKAELRAKRREAVKIFGGMMAAHTLLGGITGGLGIGAAQIIGSTINAMLDDEDKIDWNVAIFDSLSEMTNDYWANTIMHGAPALVGARMSGSINLGNLIFGSRGRDLSEHGGFAMSLIDSLGPVASWTTGAGQAVFSYADNDIGFDKMMEKVMPLKVAQGTVRAFNMANKGLTTTTGNEILPPDQFHSAYGMLQTALTAAGFRAVTPAQTQDKFYSDIKFDRRMQEQRGKLLRELVDADSFDKKLAAKRSQQEWNRRMRERGMKDLIITESTILRSRKSRASVQQEYAAGQYSKYR